MPYFVARYFSTLRQSAELLASLYQMNSAIPPWMLDVALKKLPSVRPCCGLPTVGLTLAPICTPLVRVKVLAPLNSTVQIAQVPKVCWTLLYVGAVPPAYQEKVTVRT